MLSPSLHQTSSIRIEIEQILHSYEEYLKDQILRSKVSLHILRTVCGFISHGIKKDHILEIMDKGFRNHLKSYEHYLKSMRKFSHMRYNLV